MTGAARRWAAWLVAVAMASLAFCGAAAALTRDDADAVRALRTGDVFVSNRELGAEVAGTIAERLQMKVDQMRANGFDVKMAIVSPLNGDGEFGYARRLRNRIHFSGTLVVTTLNGPVGASGDRPPEALRAAFQADRVNNLGSATERLSRAAEIAVPAPPRPPSGWRGLVAFIALALLGAAAAVGWGLRREQRRHRGVADQDRGTLVLGLDALQARLAALDARHPSPPADAAADLAQARTHHSAGRAAAQQSGHAFDHNAGFAALFAGLQAAARAAEALGDPFPVDRPLEGLCGADPAHGVATEVARLADGESRVPVCAACHDAAAAGRPPRRRLLPGVDGPVPIDEAHLWPEASPDAPGEVLTR